MECFTQILLNAILVVALIGALIAVVKMVKSMFD